MTIAASSNGRTPASCADDGGSTPPAATKFDDGWDHYRELAAAGDYNAALAEALRVAPPGSPAIGMTREEYMRHMVDNHVPNRGALTRA